MASPDYDAIQTYANITGASESIALQKLEEHGGELSEALNAHFSGWDEHNTNAAAAQYGIIDMENQTQVGSHGSLLPFLSSVRNLNPLSLLDPNYRRSFLNGLGTSLSSGQAPSISHPREARELPLGLEDGNGQSDHLGLRPTRTAIFNGPDVYGSNGEGGYNPPALNNLHHYDSDVEENMYRAAIKASKREAEESRQDNLLASTNELLQTQLYLEDDELARAVSLSLKTAEEEKTMREYPQVMEVVNSTDVEGLRRLTRENGSASYRLKQGSSSHGDGVNDGEEKPTLKQSPNHGFGKFPQVVGDTFHSKEGNEYLASRKADREKELKAIKEADKCINGGEISRKVLEEEEFEKRLLAAKEASLPEEPFVDDENAVTILVRMPDGSRHGRRFLKFDRLRSLFDFIDVGKAVKPGTYRVVQSYPRRAFSVDESASTLNEVGLTNKHEALFLEVI